MRLVIFTLCGFAAVTLFTAIDRPRADRLETFAQETAFGDSGFYKSGTSISWQGRKLKPGGGDKLKIGDGEMIRAGRDETAQLTIYRRRADREGRELFVKIDLGEYLKVEAAP